MSNVNVTIKTTAPAGAMREDREMAPIATKALGLTLDTLLIRYKHGKHDQRSHGRKGRAGRAGGAAYQAARSGGASHSEALAASRQATAAERQVMRTEAQAKRRGRLEDQAARARRAAESGQVTPAQRRTLLAKADRLEARAAENSVKGLQAQQASERGDLARKYDTEAARLQREYDDAGQAFRSATTPAERSAALQRRSAAQQELRDLPQKRRDEEDALADRHSREQVRVEANAARTREAARATAARNQQERQAEAQARATRQASDQAARSQAEAEPAAATSRPRSAQERPNTPIRPDDYAAGSPSRANDVRNWRNLSTEQLQQERLSYMRNEGGAYGRNANEARRVIDGILAERKE